MKKLQTIITIVVLSMTMFSCQTNEDLEIFAEDEDKTIANSSRAVNPVSNITVEVRYVYDAYLDLHQEALRNHYTSYFEFHGHQVCRELNGASLQETWTITEITEQEFDSIIASILAPVFYPPPTQGSTRPVNGGGPTDPPPPGFTYQLTFDYGEDCVLGN